MRAARAIHLATDWLSKLLLGFAALAVIVMVAHVTLDVLGRTLLSRPIRGTTEIVSFYYMVAAVCLPLAYVELRDEHITVDLLYMAMPLWLRKTVFVFSCLVTAGFFALFAYHSWNMAMRAMASREVVMGGTFIQIWPSRMFLPVGFGLLAAAALLRAASALVTPGDPTQEEPEVS